MVDCVTVERFKALSGYSEFAIRTKIARKVWREGEVWFRAPDGRVLISCAGYDRWAKSNYVSNGIAGPPQVAGCSLQKGGL